MSHRPYIGVTGFMHSDEVHAAITAYGEAWAEIAPGVEPTHDLMVGVLASSKTLCGQPNKYPRRYPPAEQIAGIFVHHPIALNLVHVCTDSEPSEVDGKRIPAEIDLWRGHSAGGKFCHGVQLNTERPSWKAVMGFRHAHPEVKRVVLQARPTWLAHRLEGLDGHTLLPFALGGGVITDVLIDMSGGRGRALDVSEVEHLFVRTRGQLHNYGVGDVNIALAGGLCAETLPTIARIVREFPDVSIDAEGRLRDDADGGGNLDLAKVGAYFRAAVSLIAEAPRT